MPILDQGYQHWQGALEGHLWRWLTITRQGVRGVFGNRWVWLTLLSACLPALILALFLMIWGLFEQKSSVLSPFLFLFQGLPEELRAGPRGYRTAGWLGWSGATPQTRRWRPGAPPLRGPAPATRRACRNWWLSAMDLQTKLVDGLRAKINAR